MSRQRGAPVKGRPVRSANQWGYCSLPPMQALQVVQHIEAGAVLPPLVVLQVRRGNGGGGEESIACDFHLLMMLLATPPSPPPLRRCSHATPPLPPPLRRCSLATPPSPPPLRRCSHAPPPSPLPCAGARSQPRPSIPPSSVGARSQPRLHHGSREGIRGAPGRGEGKGGRSKCFGGAGREGLVCGGLQVGKAVGHRKVVLSFSKCSPLLCKGGTMPDVPHPSPSDDPWDPGRPT